MSQEWSQIRNGLFVSGYRTANDKVLLQHLGIKRILSVVEEPEYRPHSELCRELDIDHRVFPVGDHVFEDSERKFLQTVIPWLREARDKSEPLLIHCYAGVSRSPSAIIAFLVWEILHDAEIKAVCEREGADHFTTAFGTALELVEHMHAKARPMPGTLGSFLRCIGCKLPASYVREYREQFR